jgi:hypothetical protein
MTHWAAAYVGRPWDGQHNHCWAFCRLVWRERFGLDVPEMPIDGADPRLIRRAFAGAPERGRWQRVDTPTEGDAVLMAQGARACHVGIWIDPGAVLHAVAGPGAVCTPRARLRDMGYRIVGHYRRAV